MKHYLCIHMALFLSLNAVHSHQDSKIVELSTPRGGAAAAIGGGGLLKQRRNKQPITTTDEPGRRGVLRLKFPKPKETTKVEQVSKKNNKKTKEEVLPSPPLSSKWTNVRQRTVPAVLMLGGVFLWLRLLGMENGLSMLIILLQVGLYHEVCSCVDVKQGLSTKWWWFGTVLLGTSGRALLQRHFNNIDVGLLNLLSYSTFVISLLLFVSQQNAKLSTTETFRKNLAQLAASHFVMFITTVQSSFWFHTLFEFGHEWILFPAALVIINDTMAYVFGVLFGKHALLPIISPKKTWEGFLGALLSTVAMSQPLYEYMIDSSSSTACAVDSDTLYYWMIPALFVSLVSPFGGFLASITKRAYEKKDFANFIPGHGGFTDRFDCQVVTAPFIYLWLKYMC